jgi:hypothetical protein
VRGRHLHRPVWIRLSGRGRRGSRGDSRHRTRGAFDYAPGTARRLRRQRLPRTYRSRYARTRRRRQGPRGYGNIPIHRPGARRLNRGLRQWRMNRTTARQGRTKRPENGNRTLRFRAGESRGRFLGYRSRRGRRRQCRRLRRPGTRSRALHTWRRRGRDWRRALMHFFRPLWRRRLDDGLGLGFLIRLAIAVVCVPV